MIYFKHNEIDGCSNCIEFEAVIDNISAGRCVLLLEEDAVVTEISYDSDKTFIIEGLIKAAFNYSANRNYYIGKCTAKGIDEYLLKMNFTETDGIFTSDIPSILIGNCKNCSK